LATTNLIIGCTVIFNTIFGVLEGNIIRNWIGAAIIFVSSYYLVTEKMPKFIAEKIFKQA